MGGKVDPWWWATAALLLLLPTLAGCERADTPPTYGQTLRDTSERQERSLMGQTGLPIVVDPGTGCQYIGYTGHGVTPRMVWDERRQEMMQMGCRITEEPMVNPVTGK